MLSPNARQRIYEETKALLKAQTEKYRQARKAQERRLGCLTAIFTLLLAISRGSSGGDK